MCVCVFKKKKMEGGGCYAVPYLLYICIRVPFIVSGISFYFVFILFAYLCFCAFACWGLLCFCVFVVVLLLFLGGGGGGGYKS